MRSAMLAILTLSAAATAVIAGPKPAAAFDYPYCMQGKDIGNPGDCSYRSYAECVTTASGRGLDCNINPRVAFAQQPRPGRPYRNYNY